MPDETPVPSSAPATPAAAAVAAPSPVVPAATPAPTGQPGATPLPSGATVTITTEAYQALVALQPQISQLQTEQRQRDDAARSEQLRLMALQGKVEEAMRETRDDAERRVSTERASRLAIEERAKRYAIDGELAKALAGVPLNPGAASQLTHLFRGNFSAAPEGESFTVRTAGGQNAAEFLAAQLAHPDFAHFRPPTSTGGTGGTNGGQNAPPTPAANPAPVEAPATLGEAIILHMQGIQGKKATDARVDMSQPMGLKRLAN